MLCISAVGRLDLKKLGRVASLIIDFGDETYDRGRILMANQTWENHV
jgi:hypothetical protein